MRALLIELLDEVIEAPLLPPHRGGRRSGGLLLESLVHPLVTTVLLRLPRFDQLGIDAESDPPDREATESADGGGCERDAVVGTDDLGKPIFLESSAEHRLSTFV